MGSLEGARVKQRKNGYSIYLWVEGDLVHLTLFSVCYWIGISSSFKEMYLHNRSVVDSFPVFPILGQFGEDTEDSGWIPWFRKLCGLSAAKAEKHLKKKQESK